MNYKCQYKYPYYRLILKIYHVKLVLCKSSIITVFKNICQGRVYRGRPNSIVS